MSGGIGRRLARLEGPANREFPGVVPDWCVKGATEWAQLGFIEPEKIGSRAAEIARNYRGEREYTERMQNMWHSFVVDGNDKAFEGWR
ncbi:MAG: hypothetical protein ACOZEN_09455 [Thermodesulfobacteriota bacterium]